MRAEHIRNETPFTLAGADLVACGSGALWWPDRSLMVVSDLHLGKSERMARRGGPMLPPYETQDTLHRLDDEIARRDPRAVICLGDSFDDDAAQGGLTEAEILWLSRLMAGRRWVWIEGNHDPGPVTLGGTHMGELHEPPLTFRHIARDSASGEVSGHYHPKATLNARGRQVSRPCFLYDSDRVILPAFGTYTGGLRSTAPELCGLMRREAMAILTGGFTVEIPMPRGAA
ncbi:ligase-associated DNA damage response endonuclease PdeM [Psychromarinibacter sp. C21-152]|uniref:Ligase-associated DNA damage response endonuclease PdeM n=1 Tax=Psychromarinibacter sediminicola TaxID=3033385 RepID=A0AAE3T8S6_9RHOB|nr:ligase-associated DNA damage response endonuclease PdeM [Psychromarinibacter sediminicola]MDF0599815.1 ligase-associated DNA damage response endonuclease PdeM [Psychromarinibacter sediminicola]